MHIAQNWRLKGQRYRMEGIRCEKCGKVYFPPRAICQDCRDNAANHSEDVAVPSQLELAIPMQLPVAVAERREQRSA